MLVTAGPQINGSSWGICYKKDVLPTYALHLTQSGHSLFGHLLGSRHSGFGVGVAAGVTLNGTYAFR